MVGVVSSGGKEELMGTGSGGTSKTWIRRWRLASRDELGWESRGWVEEEVEEDGKEEFRGVSI